jgi:hypothetical protein
MELDQVLKKTKGKRGKVKKKTGTKPFVATSERPYQNDLAPEPDETLMPAKKSSAAIFYTLLSCFAHDALDEAKQRTTQALTRVRGRFIKGRN